MSIINEWIMKMSYGCTMEFYYALKKKKLKLCRQMGTNRKYYILSESTQDIESQTQNVFSYM